MRTLKEAKIIALRLQKPIYIITMQNNQFVCDICYEDFDFQDHKPYVLPCGHTLCLHCCKLYNACPNDRKPYHISNIKENYAILRIIEERHQKLKNMGADVISDQLYCQLHKCERSIYCVTDKTMICSECCLFGEHQNHRFEKMDTLLGKFQTIKKKILEIKDPREMIQIESMDDIYAKRAVGVNELMEKSINFAENQFNKFIKKVCQLKDAVIDEIQNLYAPSFSSLIKSLESKRSLDNECTQIVEAFKKMKNDLSGQNVKLKTSRIYEMIEEYNSSQEAINRIREKSKEPIDCIYSIMAQSINGNIERAFSFISFSEENEKALILNKFNLGDQLNTTANIDISTDALVTSLEKKVPEQVIKNLANQFPGFITINKVIGNEVNSIFKVSFGDPKSAEQFSFLDGIKISGSQLRIALTPMGTESTGVGSQANSGRRFPLCMKANVRNALKKIKNTSSA